MNKQLELFLASENPRNHPIWTDTLEPVWFWTSENIYHKCYCGHGLNAHGDDDPCLFCQCGGFE